MKKYFAAIFISFLFLPLAPALAARSLYLGVTGSDVITLQKALITKGYLTSGSASGYFGPLTETALKKFQCAEQIACDNATTTGYGVYGPKTQAAMAARLALSSNPTTVTGASQTAAATGAFEFSGWVPDWRAASGTIDVLPHLNQLKSVMPFGYEVSSSGKLIDHAKINESPWPEFIAAAKAQKVRVVPTVLWGDAEAMHRILSNTTKRIALEDEIVAVVKQNGFDGIDIDFEGKKQETIHYFSTFLKGLYQRMGDKFVYCTVEARMPLEDRYSPGANIPADATDYANDYVEINKYCDRVELMAYDQGTISVKLNGIRQAPYAPVADPAWVESLVKLAAQSINRNKIIVGIPTYGYEYLVTPKATSSGYTYQRLWAFNPSYAENLAKQMGITPARTSAGELGFTYDPASAPTIAPAGNNSTQVQQEITPTTTSTQNSGTTEVNNSGMFNYLTWSDTSAIKDKVDLAKKLGVRGVAIFSMGGAQTPGMWEVLK